MERQLWIGRLCCQNNGVTALDGKPLFPRELLWTKGFQMFGLLKEVFLQGLSRGLPLQANSIQYV
eukprot:5176562-Amphidinium_carterae.1